MPKEFKYLQLNKEGSGKRLKFDLQQSDEIEILISNLSSVNQFLLTRIEPVLAETQSYTSSFLELDYEVLSDQKEVVYSQHLKLSFQVNNSILNKKKKIVNLPYIFNFKSKSLLFKIKVTNADRLKAILKHFVIKVKTNNEGFLFFFLYLKIILFITSIASAFIFQKRYFIQLRQSRTTEQQIIVWIGYALIAYNTPLNFYLDEVFPNMFILLLSSLINILFYSLILYFWMVSFERVMMLNNSLYYFQQKWKRLLFFVMISSGFITYSMEALFFVNDPLNIVKPHHRIFYLLFQCIYIGSCFCVLAYLMYISVQIQLKIKQVEFKDRIFFYFSIYFFFTINLCKLKSHIFGKHLHFLPKWRESAFGDHYHQPLCVSALVLLPDHPGVHFASLKLREGRAGRARILREGPQHCEAAEWTSERRFPRSRLSY